MSNEGINNGQTAPAKDQGESAQAPFVFLSYRSQEPDRKVAHDFNTELSKAGFGTFMAEECLEIGDEWPEHVDSALMQCDYFLLLLSAKSASSEMVMQEVRRVKRLREKRPDKRPLILPVRVNVPFEQELNYELDSYLGRIQQLPWQSHTDTPGIVKRVMGVIAKNEKKEQIDEEDEMGARPHRKTSRPDGPPLPVAEPEWPGGRMPRDSKFYIARTDIDDECFAHVLRPAALIRIRAPRQMGKTSLLARILNYAKEHGCATGQISFQLITGSTMADLQGFLRNFCFNVGESMGLPDRLDELWDERRDVFHNCRSYFMKYLLRAIDRPFVLGLDETDRLFPYQEVAEHFFGMLRGWIDNSEDDELWSKFRVVLVHSTECYITMSVDQSPFDNIGRGFRLPPFTEEQMGDLTRKHGLVFDADARELFELVDGHPYLSRVALYSVARERKSFRSIIENAHTEAGVFSDHLRRHYWNLSRYPELVTAFKTVVEVQAEAKTRAAAAPAKAQASVPLDNVPAFKLEGMGLVKPVNNEVTVSCELYQRYFQDRFRIIR